MTWEHHETALAPAAPQTVWDVLLDGRRWSFWNPGIEWLWLESDAQPGALATIKFRRVRQTALLIREADAPRRFALGLTVGPVARLDVTWTLTAVPTGTRIDAAIATAGIAGRLLLEKPAKRIAGALPNHLESLGARAVEAEKNARLN